MHRIINVCPVCGETQKEVSPKTKHTCSICGKTFTTDTTCKSAHYVCYTCEHLYLREKIITYCLASNQKDPLALTIELMKIPNMPMHGPIHHLLIPCALLTTYAKQKSLDLASALKIADQRSMSVPGAACAHWGACGAAIGVGIYLSIIKEITPFSTDEWKNVGQLTAQAIHQISKQGGPRCCKRDGFIAINEAIEYSNHHLETAYPLNSVTCDFFVNNQQCKNVQCPFFPKK